MLKKYHTCLFIMITAMPVLAIAEDSSVAINTQAAIRGHGGTPNVHLNAGTYHVTHQLNIGNGQCLYGDGRGNTTITVDSDFDPLAPGVIVLTGPEQFAPCVHDLDIEFAQPPDQISRANFKTLAEGCTTVKGGTGCKYPPAIYMAPHTANRVHLWNLRIARSWDGIIDLAAGGFFFEDIEMSALHVGLTTANGFDVGYINNFHFWPFDLPTAIYKNIYRDGNTFAAKIGEGDGIHVAAFTTVDARVALTNAFSWGTFTDLKLDGNDSTLEVANATGPGLQIQGVYMTGAANGADHHCQIDLAGGRAIITNISGNAAGPGGDPSTSLCVAGGDVTVMGGLIVSNNTRSRAIKQTGGRLHVTGVTFGANTGDGHYTVPLIDVRAGMITFTGNSFQPHAGMNVGGILVVKDRPDNNVSGNNFNGWSFTAPGTEGMYEPNHS